MTVFSVKQVVPVDYEAEEVSQRLLEASLADDVVSVDECIVDPIVDVNFIGAVSLKTRKSEIVLRGDESAIEVKVEYEEFKTEVTPLFVAVHCGNVSLVKKLLNIGADVNQKLFKGFATTVAVREGYFQILEILIKAGASQPACEEALLEASCHGRARHVELLMCSDLIRPQIAVHALATACCRGYTDVVEALIKCGVDTNATDRLLLQSSMPALHTNVDCTALVAAVVSRQVPVVRLLLQEGVRTDIKVRLGAWSWETHTGEEFRVGAGLADPYPITWSAVEYFEATGTILSMLLKHHSPNAPHLGRCLLHHAILCNNPGAVKTLLKCGANVENLVETTRKIKVRPIHMAARLGSSAILQCLIDSGCDLNSKTDSGDTAMMICANYKNEESLRVLAKAGADVGLLNNSGLSVSSIAGSNFWILGLQRAIIDVIKTGMIPKSSNLSVFCSLLFASETGDVEALRILIEEKSINIDYQDDNGFSAVMVAAMKGHVEAFKLLVYAGADVKLCNKAGETAITLSELNPSHILFEKVMLEFALEKGNRNSGGFYALHCAARHGDLDAVRLLTCKGYDVNLLDGDNYTPLMLAAREGYGAVCKILISRGAHCDIKNSKGETALSLARNDAEGVILDEIACNLVLRGTQLQKHTRAGKGSPHGREVKMIGSNGMLRWGKSSRRIRNVICMKAEVGPSQSFKKNRKEKGGDANHPGVFRVVTTKNKEVHFVCEGGVEAAKLWVRGIKLVTKNASSS
ncbi:hypothetical protein ACFE04_009401 [Oxalis oulophora]